ncbi:conserved oligomeric Golgi complex subunit 7 [Olea europaea subsp. europaea]|uniref:Conserved oligomeric Golgi complex subunit 7 n=1 Tax=Olea europaea subsp. europaea TaxID=158383 RepID=A0A8S0TX60_OLEEU|nr:conserved oligomeric Golgi complex subunit 7 [Olea europaea subsp. europaea]
MNFDGPYTDRLGSLQTIRALQKGFQTLIGNRRVEEFQTEMTPEVVKLSETVRRMEESIPHVIPLLEAAAERSIDFTGGSEADEPTLVLDDTLLQYISTLQGILKSRRAVTGVDVTPDGFGVKNETGSDNKGASHARKVDFMSNEEWSFVQGIDQNLLKVADATNYKFSCDANAEEAQFFSTEWMFKVAEGATALYIEQLRGIQYITDHGAQELSVDIEYLSNVFSALSMTIPPTLATFHTCFQTPRDQLKELVKSD